HRPWPRAIVAAEGWRDAIGLLAVGEWTLVGLWGEASMVHMALLDETVGSVAVLSLDCPDRRFPAVGETHPPAIRLERTIRDLFGLEPVRLVDQRPWLDHGSWGVGHPLGAPSESGGPHAAYAFLPAEGESLHQIAVGPV